MWWAMVSILGCHQRSSTHCVRHGHLRLSQGSDTGALGSGFHGIRRVRLELMAFFSSLLLRVQIYGLFLVIPGRKGSRWSQLGLGRGWSLMHSTHHLLMALAPGLGSALTLSELHPFLSLMRATPEGHTCLLRGAE